MTPQFPHFKKLAIDDKHIIGDFVSQFPPYSDYNFVSMWSYNVNDQAEWTFLNDNLVLKFHDYMTGLPFLTLLGKNEIKNSIHKLHQHAKDIGIEPTLQLIPEIVTQAEKTLFNDFHIQEDVDGHDYILATDRVHALQGKKYRGKKNFVARFLRKHPKHIVKEIDLKDTKTHEEIVGVFIEWEKSQGRDRADTNTELMAVQRLLRSAEDFELFCLGLYIDGKLVGFSINEAIHDNHGIIHFEKADVTYEGIFPFLKQKSAEYFKKLGRSHINYEQDLGIEGLRKAKQSWGPVHYLKKYKVFPKK